MLAKIIGDEEHYLSTNVLLRGIGVHVIVSKENSDFIYR